jgi:Tol biopolymer transport system component
VIKQSSNFAAFSETVNVFDDLNDGRSASGNATQDTTVDFSDPLASRVDTDGVAQASWTDGEAGDGDDPAARGSSEFTVTFEVTDAASPFSLVGSIEAAAGATNVACTTVTVTSPSGATFDASSPAGCGPSQQSIDESGELSVGTHTFSVVASALASNLNATGGTAEASFNLHLSIDSVAPAIDGVEFTQGIQQLQTLSELHTSLGGASATSGAAATEQGVIAFVSWPDRTNLKVINADGSGLRTVASTTSLGGFATLDWSPDGTRLATAGGGSPGLKIIDFATGAMMPLTSGGDSDPSWSPDGQRIAFTRVSDPTTTRHNDIWVVDVASGVEQKLTGDNIFWEHSTTWSPDGTRILFSATDLVSEDETPDDYDLFTVTLDNHAIVNVTNTLDAIEAEADWSWHGTGEIVSSRATHLGAGYHLTVMNADGSGAREITHGTGNSFYPDWSSGGTRIAYSDSSCTVRIVDADGANDAPLTGGCWPRWQPKSSTQVEFTQGIQELQPVSALQVDLAGDGQPPVPIVAGKPAAMRVYFAEVEQTTHYVVQVTGVVSGTKQVILDPGCTPTDRRRQDAGCSSVDFFFTPPEGSWSLTLDVRDFGGTTILNEGFHLTSVKTKPLNIVAVPVCDGSGCGLASDVARAIGLLRATYPGTVNVSFASGGNVTRPTTNSDGGWWSAVLADLVAMRTADGVTGDVYYHGSVRTSAGGFTPATGGILGMGRRPGVAAATRLNVSATDISGTSSPADEQVIAHEVGHNLGREHVPTVAGTTCYGTPDPNSLDAGWPHPNPLIAEVGFDVANAKAKREDQFTDIMAYCLPGWTSVYNYTSLMDSVTLSPEPAAVAQGQATGEFWEVSGSIDGPSAILNPIFDVDTTAGTGAGSGSYRIEVRDGNGGLLFTRMFQPSESHWPGVAELESFFELIPVQAGAAQLAVFDPFNTLLVERELSGAAPAVEFGDVVPSGDSINASWSVTDPDSSTHSYRLEFSTDGGANWHILIPHLDDPNVELDASALPGSSQMQLRVQASDGAATSEATSETFAVPEHAPEAEIIPPAGGTFRVGQLVPLLVAAFDADDGTLDDAEVSWSSSLDGALGNGASLPLYDLSPGQHTITMTARDSDNNTVTDSITLTVFDGPIVEAGALADIDCSGDVGAPDALALLFHLSGLDSGSCKTIGAGEPIAFGDVDCDGSVDVGDLVAILALVADLPSGCTSTASLRQ